jgi:molybdenum cofactor biosynthesis enzyme MoaA
MSCATVKLTALRELWFHTGTACNLECPFCLEDSKPGDTRLERVSLADLKVYLDEGAQLGVERFCFTGGEPLIVKDIVKILQYALHLKPCLVFTNGTAPLIKRVHQLQLLKQQSQALAFRVSIDHPNEQLHDAQRGWGNFKRAMEGLKQLHRAGFDVSIARHAKPDEDADAVAARYRDLLYKHELPELPLLALPELGRPGLPSLATPPSLDELRRTQHKPMCATSRMVLKRGGQTRAYACALTDDDPRFDLGPALGASLDCIVKLEHHRCTQCVRLGATLSG